MTEHESIHVLMGRVLAEMPAVAKNNSASSNMGGYKFRGIEDIMTVLKPCLAKHGVFCIPKVLERQAGEWPVGNNKMMHVVDLHVRWTFHGPNGDSVEGDTWGCGSDMGDKATQKAMTAAFKSLLNPTLAIGDSADDAEAHDVPNTERPTPSDWYKQSGWEDEAEHDRWRDATIARLRGLDEVEREAARDWLRDNRLSLTVSWNRSQADVFTAKLDGGEFPRRRTGPEVPPASAGDVAPVTQRHGARKDSAQANQSAVAAASNAIDAMAPEAQDRVFHALGDLANRNWDTGITEAELRRVQAAIDDELGRPFEPAAEPEPAVR